MPNIKIITSLNAKKCYELDKESINLWSFKQWENELKRNGVEALGILENTKIIGVCVFQFLFDYAELNFICIHPSYRKKGFGKKLINKFFLKCEKNSIRKILLEVSNKNYEALSFYSSCGFRTIGIREKYYKDGSDALIKEKKLLKI